MISRLIATLRKGLRAGVADGCKRPFDGEPVSEVTPSRSLSAPSDWLCAITDIGRCRPNNEDLFYLSDDRRLWIVADGMGGHAAGEVASALTVEAIAASHAAALLSAPRTATLPGDHLVQAFARAQDWVSRQSLGADEWRGMGSTAIAGMIEGEALHVCHVGDVRAYHMSRGTFRRITNDHSWVWEQLVLSGLLTPEQARSHPQRGKITQAIGSPQGIRPELNKISLRRGDRVLLCSDGLWEAIADEHMGAIVAADGSMKKLASALVDMANAAGGADNITAILYEHDSRFRCI